MGNLLLRIDTRHLLIQVREMFVKEQRHPLKRDPHLFGNLPEGVQFYKQSFEID